MTKNKQMELTDIIKGTEYELSLFSKDKISTLKERITERKTQKGVDYYITCLVRKKDIKLTPEETVRQLYLLVLTQDLGYPVSRIALEFEVTFGREKKRADIVVFDKQQTTSPYIIVELKKPKLKDGKEQLKSYCNATGAPIGVWSNGRQISYYHRKDPNYFEDLSMLPRADQKLSDILSERWKIADLIKKDKLVTERKSLKDLILEMEDEVLANAGVDVFEEVFKLSSPSFMMKWRADANLTETLNSATTVTRKPNLHLKYKTFSMKPKRNGKEYSTATVR